jgi:hypothetical protein
MTTTLTPIGEVVADDRGRVSIGKAKSTPGSRYLMSVDEHGGIHLLPVVSIPAWELDVWENPELMASIMRGLRQAADGETFTWGEVFGDTP